MIRGTPVARILALAAVLALPLAPSAAEATPPGAATPDTARVLGAANPLLPRGGILFEVQGGHTIVRNVHVDGALRPLGEAYFAPGLDVGRLPQLQATEARFQELLGPGSDWILDLGRVRGRFHAQEQEVPLRLGYGVLDRLTVGVTVPLVRRRIDSLLRLSGEDATAGTNPAATDSEQVDAFLAAVLQALAELQQRVEDECQPPPPDEPEAGAVNGTRCEAGEELLARTSTFVEGLEAAYAQELVFPLRGTQGGFALLDRWLGFRSDLAKWNVSAPAELPLSRTPLDDARFASTFVEPVWGDEGFPRDRPEEYMLMGDVEVHAVLGLVDTRIGRPGLRVRSSVVGTLRFGTGNPDTLQALAPMGPPRGADGVGVRLVTDLISDRRVGVLTVAELWQFSDVETVILAPDPRRFLGETAVARVPVAWTPGATLKLQVTPRFHLTPGISLGLGYDLDRRQAPSFTALNGGADALAALAALEGGTTLHRIRGELRYHGFEGAVADALPFPIEVVASYEGPLTGTGVLALAERRARIGVRVLRGGR
jgi:hypothetical protein